MSFHGALTLYLKFKTHVECLRHNYNIVKTYEFTDAIKLKSPFLLDVGVTASDVKQSLNETTFKI